jgi:hypothetical protein
MKISAIATTKVLVAATEMTTTMMKWMMKALILLSLLFGIKRVNTIIKLFTLLRVCQNFLSRCNVYKHFLRFVFFFLILKIV